MVCNTFGRIFRATTWGESHGPAMGVVVDGCPAGLEVEDEDVQIELDKRTPGKSAVSSPRREKDKVEILSGVFEGRTLGTPISIIIRNTDVDSSKYDNLSDVYRPGHADYTYDKKYGLRDYRGGGRSSGRETLSRVAAGAIAKKLLKMEGISICSYAKQIGSIIAEVKDLGEAERNSVKSPDRKAAKSMEEAVLEAKREGDSLGGIGEIIISGCPPSLGDPVFGKLDAELSRAIISIGSVKGVEFGKGFGVAGMKGSENNDQISAEKFLSNNAGGILGGISTGQDIIIRFAVKPTPSISIEQKTIDNKGKSRNISVEGRHDPCIVPRVLPVAESMAALVLADKLMIQRIQGRRDGKQ